MPDIAVHGATILKGGGEAWAQCLCGWVSRSVRSREAASVLWAEHIAEHIAGDGQQP